MPRVSISSLRPHPGNARRGDIDMIADSLRHHGQYRPVIVDQDGIILAGHHVVEAARRLGWQEIAVHAVTVTPETGHRILVADNRISDLAAYDVPALVDLLHGFDGDLSGTGFTIDDLAIMESGLLDEPRAGSGLPAPDDDENVKVKCGQHRFTVRPEPFASWRAALIEEAGTPRAARRLIRARLGIPEKEKIEPGPASTAPPPEIAGEVETIPCAELLPLAGNAREGDIGAIVESLRAFGQYKPLVVTQDNVVIIGNHTLAAAMALGWDRVHAVRVHVDDDQARRIAVIDNRSSDVATYDDDELRLLVGSIADLTGIGYDGEDVQDLMSGGPSRRGHSSRNVTFIVGDLRFMVPRATYVLWSADLPPDYEGTEIATRLGIPADACLFT